MARLVVLAAALAAAGYAPAADPKSGPQVGSTVPGPFEPLHLTGPDAGDEACLYCKFGNDPVVMIFARTVTPGLTALAAKVEKAAAGHKADRLGTCVILLDTSAAAKAAGRKLADAADLRETVVACIDPETKALADYELAAGADVTVLLYSRKTVRANHAFAPGGLTDAAADTVLADLPKILPAK